MSLLECEFMDWCQVVKQSNQMLNGSTFAWRFGLPAQLALCQGLRVSCRLKFDVSWLISVQDLATKVGQISNYFTVRYS